jgi:hypothetical protein
MRQTRKAKRSRKATKAKKTRRARRTRQKGGDYSMPTEAAPISVPLPLTRSAVVTMDGGPTLSVHEWLKNQDKRELGAYNRPYD